MSNPYPPPNPYAPQGPPQQPNPYGGPVPPPPSGYPPPPAGYGYPAAPPPPPAFPQQPAPYNQPYDQPGYGSQGPYVQPGYGPQGPYGKPAGYGHPGGGPVCRICGGFPAADVTVHGHRGMIVIMQFLRRPGPYCRVCGTATVRDMSQQTLLRGWWGYLSTLFTIIALLRTRATYGKIRQLPPPAPGTHGPQLDPGVPLTKRGAIYMLAVPILPLLVVLVLLIAGAALGTGSGGSTSSSSSVSGGNSGTSGTSGTSGSSRGTSASSSVDHAKVGDCLYNQHQTSGTTDSNADVVVLPCSDPKAFYKVLGKVPGTSDDKTACQSYSNSTSSYISENGAKSYVLCLGPNV